MLNPSILVACMLLSIGYTGLQFNTNTLQVQAYATYQPVKHSRTKLWPSPAQPSPRRRAFSTAGAPCVACNMPRSCWVYSLQSFQRQRTWISRVGVQLAIMMQIKSKVMTRSFYTHNMKRTTRACLAAAGGSWSSKFTSTWLWEAAAGTRFRLLTCAVQFLR